MSVRITARRLSVQAAYEEISVEGCGGRVLFAGVVRPDRTRKGRVIALDYDADRVPALGALQRLAKKARARFKVKAVVLWHRTGRLAAGEESVIVGVAAPHRAQAYGASRFLIESLKTGVPIWKVDVVRPLRGRAK